MLIASVRKKNAINRLNMPGRAFFLDILPNLSPEYKLFKKALNVHLVTFFADFLNYDTIFSPGFPLQNRKSPNNQQE